MSDTSVALNASDQSHPPETEFVSSTRICCDGGTLGHPRVWLQIDPTVGWVECGYCDKRFILRGGAADV